MAAFIYGWSDSGPTCAHTYVVPKLMSLVPNDSRRVVDIGCGNGYLAGLLAARGLDVIGVEPSADGIAQARAAYPALRFEQGSVEDEWCDRIGGGFDVVVATEVIEHLYAPRRLLALGHQLLRPGGRMLVTTPYHGYLKNLALALAGGWDRHFTVGWDGGHIKFFSPATLEQMLREAGFASVRFEYAGRVRWVWKSMIAIATKHE